MSFIFCLNIKRHLLLLCLYIKYIIVLGIYYDCVYIYGIIWGQPEVKKASILHYSIDIYFQQK